MCKNLYMMCDETNSIVQEISLEDEDIGFQDKDIALEDETKVEELEQSKEITITPPKDLPENGELKKTSPWTTLLAKYQKEYLLALDSRFYAIAWLLLLRLNQET